MAVETGNSKTLQVLKHFIENGWPNESHPVPPEIYPYFALREEMVIDNEVIYYGNRCVIPQSMSREMLTARTWVLKRHRDAFEKPFSGLT